MGFQDFIVKLISKFSFNDLGQNLSLSRELSLDRDVGEDFFIEAMNLADF